MKRSIEFFVTCPFLHFTRTFTTKLVVTFHTNLLHIFGGLNQRSQHFEQNRQFDQPRNFQFNYPHNQTRPLNNQFQRNQNYSSNNFRHERADSDSSFDFSDIESVASHRRLSSPAAIPMYSDLHRRRSASLYGGSVSPREEMLRAQMMGGGLHGSLYDYPMMGGSLYGPPMSRYGGAGGMYGGLGMGCRPSSVMGMSGMGYGMGGMRSGMGYGGMGYGGMGYGGMGYGGMGYGGMGYGGYGRPFRTGGLVESRSPHMCRAKSWSAHARLF